MADLTSRLNEIVEHHSEVIDRSTTHIRQRTNVLQRVAVAIESQDNQELTFCFSDLVDLVMLMGEDANDLVKCNLEIIDWLQEYRKEHK